MQYRPNDAKKQPLLSAEIPVLARKLAPPLSSPSSVPRLLLDRQIQDADGVKLILMQAPAGYGKTTAMLQYHAHLKTQGVAVAWLSLDPADNDVERFIAYLAAALNQIEPAFVLPPAAMVDVDGFALDLINRIAAIERRFVLFLDEAELIQDKIVLGLLRKIVQGLPAQGTLVIGSRDSIDLGRGRLRAHGHLLEIGPGSLRFSIEEATCLLREKRHLALADDDVAKLLRCTEGWVTAIQLAALALAGRGDQKNFVAMFSGSNTDIADYLAEDVLANQSAEVRSFLLASSILDELSVPLCEAVCGAGNGIGNGIGNGNGRDMLTRLERANLFLVPLDNERRWYRYHSVFAEFLRAQLEDQFPDQVAILHRRAADWYAANERPVPAIEHALASGALDLARALLEQHAEHLLWRGRVRLLTRWLDALSAALIEPSELSPKLRFTYAWALCLTRRYPDTTLQLAALEDATAGGVPDTDFKARIAALQALVLAMTDQAEACYRHCRSNLPALMSLEPFSRGVAANSLAFCMIAASEFTEAHQLLDQARHSHAQLDGTFNISISENIEGVIDLLQGRLQAAIARLRSAYLRVPLAGPGATGGRSSTCVLLALALYEADELDEAEALLTECAPFVKQTGTPDAIISAHLTLARIHFLRGDRPAALRLLSDMEHFGHQSNLPRVVASAWLERGRLALQQGDLVAAQEYLRHADMREVWQRFEKFSNHANDIDMMPLANARLLIQLGKAEHALPLLKELLAQAEAAQRWRRALKLNILLVSALHACDRHNQAMRLLRDALRFAGREGFVRAFADEGPLIVKLVRELRSAGSRDAEDGAGTVGIAPEFLDRILRAAGQTGDAQQDSAPPSALVDPLSEREIQVLRLLAEGHPNKTLAERLFVSETTIKAHLRNINTKLAARNRMDAVAIARRHGLI